MYTGIRTGYFRRHVGRSRVTQRGHPSLKHLARASRTVRRHKNAMTHRHLLPDEIDQLLDGEVGFGTAPLEAHIRECAECRAELEAGRRVVEAIEHLPRLTPSPLFAEHTIARVHVYEPWDVAARDTVVRWVAWLVPQSRSLRIVGGAVGLSLAAALSVACVWLVAHADAVFFFGSIARVRLRDAVLEQIGGAVSAVFGPQSIDAIRVGGPALLFGLFTTIVALVVVVAFMVRSAVSTSRRGRP
jgi:hypothetical protein